MELSIADIRTILVGWRDGLSAAINALDPLISEPGAAQALGPAVVPQPAPSPAVRREKQAKKTGKGLDGDIGEAILSALRRKSPQSPGELASAVNLSRSNLRYHLKPLEHNGAVSVSGTTASRRIRLASGRAAKEAP